MCVQYIRGCSIHRGDPISTSEGYHDTCGDIMSTLGDVQFIGGLPWCMLGDIMIHVGDIMSTLAFSIQVKGFYKFAPPHES